MQPGSVAMSSGNEELMRQALADLGQSVLSNWEKKDREMARLRQALLRAFDEHGHRYNCSAARGPHSDCTCGWLEVMELVKQMRGEE
jgi:hypothetical protein